MKAGFCRTARSLPALRWAVLLGLPVLLWACDFFFASPFPDTVTRMVARSDITDVFPYDPQGYHRLVVRNRPDGSEYVLAFSEGPATGIQVAIFDSDLRHLHTERQPPGEDLFGGGAQVLFGDGNRLFVGRLAFNVSDFTQPPDPALWNKYYEGGFYDTGVLGYLFPLFAAPDRLDWQFDSPDDLIGVSWGAGPSLTGGAVPYSRLMGVFHDMEQGVVACYLRSETTGTVAGVYGTEADFFDSLPEPILPSSSGFAISRDAVDELWYTRRGTVIFSRGYDNDPDEIAVYDLSPAASLIRVYRLQDRGDVRYAYSVDGRYWYTLDVRRGTLVKARTWW